MDFAQLPERVELDTMEALLALDSPQRLRLVEALADPRSAKEAAQRLGVPVTGLYYHLDRLLEHGIIQVVEERPARPVPERVFQITGKSFVPSASFLEDHGEEGLAAAAAVAFRHAEAMLATAWSSGAVDLSADQERANAHVGLALLRLDPARVTELVRRLRELTAEFSEDDGTVPVSMFVAVHPRSVDDGGEGASG